jgi:hypothetical protein
MFVSLLLHTMTLLVKQRRLRIIMTRLRVVLLLVLVVLASRFGILMMRILGSRLLSRGRVVRIYIMLLCSGSRLIMQQQRHLREFLAPCASGE